MTNRPRVNLNLSKRAGLLLAGFVAVATPAILGITDASELRAQTQAAPTQQISGTWQGKLSSPQDPNGELRLVFKISTADGGTLKALVYAIDLRDPTPFSATSVTLKGSTLQVSIQLLQSAFEGTLGADGNTIVGKWTQGTNAVPLNLVRATDQTAWAIPEPPPPVRMRADARPEFAVATIKPSRPDAPRGGYGIRGQDVTTTNVTLSWMIKLAYNVHANQISD